MNATQHAQPQRVNGSAPAAAPTSESTPVSINPQEAANLALMFLGRCDMKPGEREAFARVELMLQAIARGQLQLSAPSESSTSSPSEAAAGSARSRGSR